MKLFKMSSASVSEAVGSLVDILVQDVVSLAAPAEEENNTDLDGGVTTISSQTSRKFQPSRTLLVKRKRGRPYSRETRVLTKKKKGKPKAAVWRTKIFLHQHAEVDYFPPQAEADYLQSYGLGSPWCTDRSGKIEIQRDCTLSELETLIYSLYPQYPLRAVGIRFAKCAKNKKVMLLQPSTVNDLECTVKHGQLLIIPNRDLPIRCDDSNVIRIVPDRRVPSPVPTTYISTTVENDPVSSIADAEVVLVPDRMEKLLDRGGEKLGINAARIFTIQGGEIDDVQLIRDNDVLYVSAGEAFIGTAKESTSSVPTSATPGEPATSNTNNEWVTLNVGGRHFMTTRNTLVVNAPDSMLARMFARHDDGSHMWPSSLDSKGAYLIDRNPTYFEPLLNFLRHGELILDKNINPQGVLEEAKFFGIETLIPMLQSIMQVGSFSRDSVALTRRNVIDAIIRTSHTSELRFQGVNLEGADLSRLDLRNINFKFAILRKAKLTGANLSFCCMERADLSFTNMEGTTLMGVKMLCANLESANLKSCNFEDPAGCRANMEGVNLKSAILEGSQMAGVNLRVATLKNANLQNCDLRGAILAGADLENCDLSGSDLHEANLRGANLKDATFELMLTPLHMSQAIR